MLPLIVRDHLQRALQHEQPAAQKSLNVQRSHEREIVCHAEHCLVRQKGNMAYTKLLTLYLRLDIGQANRLGRSHYSQFSSEDVTG